jgi:hypothetical protein
MLVDAEWLHRENRRLARALKEAKLKLSQACVEDIDYPARRELDKAVVRGRGSSMNFGWLTRTAATSASSRGSRASTSSSSMTLPSLRSPMSNDATSSSYSRIGTEHDRRSLPAARAERLARLPRGPDPRRRHLRPDRPSLPPARAKGPSRRKEKPAEKSQDSPASLRSDPIKMRRSRRSRSSDRGDHVDRNAHTTKAGAPDPARWPAPLSASSPVRPPPQIETRSSRI